MRLDRSGDARRSVQPDDIEETGSELANGLPMPAAKVGWLPRAVFQCFGLKYTEIMSGFQFRLAQPNATALFAHIVPVSPHVDAAVLDNVTKPV